MLKVRGINLVKLINCNSEQKENKSFSTYFYSEILIVFVNICLSLFHVFMLCGHFCVYATKFVCNSLHWILTALCMIN